MEGLKVCKCCGVEKEISEFDLSNSRKPISLCKPCRRAQQQISILSKLPKRTEAQAARLQAAINYMNNCNAVTGFTTGGYSSRVGMNAVASKVPSVSDLHKRYEEAQKRRKLLEENGVKPPAPTLEIIMTQPVEFLVDCGYTANECYAVLDAEVNKELPTYDEIEDKLYAFPRD